MKDSGGQGEHITATTSLTSGLPGFVTSAATTITDIGGGVGVGSGGETGSGSGGRRGALQQAMSSVKPQRQKTKETDAQPSREWNTKNLPARVAVDAMSAGCAAALVAPLIATIDRGIMENASGKASLKDSVIKSFKTLLFRPHQFIFSKPLGLILAVYGSTYLVANSVDTASSTVRSKPASYVTHGTAKFAGTSVTNLSIGIWKDSHYTRLFSTAAPKPLPKPTYALFALRDSFTIFASFNLPPLLAPHVPRELLPDFMKSVKSQSIAQFVAPAAIQLLSTPVHLLGLDLYNRANLSLADRWTLIRGAWMPSFVARVCRIVPAFGVGGVVNTSVRDRFMKKLE